MITTEKAVELCNAAMNRDPRKFPYGYFAGGSAGIDTARVFMWFASEADLINHIIECEPPVYEVDSDESDSAIRDTEIDDFIELIKNYGF